MYRDHKVIAVTPAGRQQYMEILSPYVLRDRHIFDRWIIWVNTPYAHDISYIESLRRKHHDFIELVYPDAPLEKGKSRPQPPYFRTTAAADALYVKFDDDICWVAPDAVERLVEFRLDHPDPFFVMSNTIVNPTCAHIHCKYNAQDFLVDGEYQRISPDYGNKVWSEVPYAEYVHKTFIEDLLNDDIEKYKFDEWLLDGYPRVAINCICWSGKDLAPHIPIPHHDEEVWMSCIKAKELGRPNMICGRSLVAHFAFYRHRKARCVGREIDHRILRAYRLIQRGHPPDAVRRALIAKGLM